LVCAGMACFTLPMYWYSPDQQYGYCDLLQHDAASVLPALTISNLENSV
jgi:hypothetical protein